MKHRKSIFRNFALVTQLGLSMMTPIFLCILAGYLIDKKLETQTTFWFLIAGFLAGARNAYLLAKRTIEINRQDEEKEDSEDEN